MFGSTEMNGCQVGKWFVGNRGVTISRIFHGCFICCDKLNNKSIQCLGNE